MFRLLWNVPIGANAVRHPNVLSHDSSSPRHHRQTRGMAPDPIMVEYKLRPRKALYAKVCGMPFIFALNILLLCLRCALVPQSLH